MGLFKKISSLRYERRKRKQEKEVGKFNQRQEELDNIFDYQYHTKHVDYIFKRCGLE